MKSICVPTSAAAMLRLDKDSCIEGDLVSIDLDQDEFEMLLKSGLFGALNSALDSMIDEFEDEVILFENISVAISIYNDYIDKIDIENDKRTKFTQIFETAEKNKTGVFLFL